MGRGVHLAEVRRGKRHQVSGRQRQAQASAQAVADRASLLGLGGLGMPNRTDQAAALLNGDESAYDFLSGLTHADPAEIHHLIGFASDRDGAGWSRGVAVVSAVMLLEPLQAHGRAFVRFLEVSSADNYAATEQDLQAVLRAVTTAVNQAAPPHW